MITGAGGKKAPGQRSTIRARLTLGIGALFFIIAGAVVAINYWIVDRALDPHVEVELPGGNVLTVPESAEPVARSVVLTPGELQNKLVESREQLKETALQTLLAQSGLLLLIVSFLAVLLGFIAANKMLRPVHSITETARRVAQSRLHERIALSGPNDELKELADTFDDMLERLDLSFSAQSRFVGNASHELRTPIAATRVACEVALANPNSSGGVRALARSVLQMTDRQQVMIERLLQLARAEGALATREPVDLGHVCSAVIDDMWQLGHGSQLRFLVDIPSTSLLGDETLLRQLVDNLVQNAIKYNYPGGWVRVRCVRSDGEAVLEVENSGQIVSTEDAERLFEPFWRARGRVDGASGSGLGLSIVRAIVQGHQGQVDAVPRSDGGLVVTARLPAPENNREG